MGRGPSWDPCSRGKEGTGSEYQNSAKKKTEKNGNQPLRGSGSVERGEIRNRDRFWRKKHVLAQRERIRQETTLGAERADISWKNSRNPLER